MSTSVTEVLVEEIFADFLEWKAEMETGFLEV